MCVPFLTASHLIHTWITSFLICCSCYNSPLFFILAAHPLILIYFISVFFKQFFHFLFFSWLFFLLNITQRNCPPYFAPSVYWLSLTHSLTHTHTHTHTHTAVVGDVSEEQLYMFKVVVDMIAKYLITDGLDLDFNIIGKVRTRIHHITSHHITSHHIVSFSSTSFSIFFYLFLYL